MSECPNFEIQTQTQNIDFQTAFVLFFSFFQRRKKASIYNTWIFTVRSLKKLDPLALFAPCWLISNYKWHLSHNNRRESSHWHDIYLFTCHLLRFLKIHWVLTRYIYIYDDIYDMFCADGWKIIGVAKMIWWLCRRSTGHSKDSNDHMPKSDLL